MARSVQLEAHGFVAELHPEAGACLTRLAWRGRDLLRTPDGEAPGVASPNRFGLWPMVPFCNRAFGAVVDDGGERFALPVNDPATGSAIHGFGWQSAWSATGPGTGRIVLEHRRTAAGDPYAYRALLTVELEPDLARIGLSVTNEAARPLPFGIGLHPWFPAAGDTRLSFRALGALALGPGYRAHGLDAWAEGGPFAGGRTVLSGQELALAVVGWTGRAILDTPSQGVSLAIEASGNLAHPVLWTPAGADFVCFEPQSHALGAPSEEAARAVTPLTRLAPGETLAGWMTLAPRETQRRS